MKKRKPEPEPVPERIQKQERKGKENENEKKEKGKRIENRGSPGATTFSTGPGPHSRGTHSTLTNHSHHFPHFEQTKRKGKEKRRRRKEGRKEGRKEKTETERLKSYAAGIIPYFAKENPSNVANSSAHPSPTSPTWCMSTSPASPARPARISASLPATSSFSFG